MKRTIVSILLAMTLVAACSSSEGSDTTQADGPGTDTTQPAADPASDTTTAAPDTESEIPTPPADGRYMVGDTYFDVDLSATYLGLAKIPVGPDIYTGGSCYTVLLEINRYADTIGLGPEKFSASTTGILADGTEAENDNTGVGCDLKPLAELGYERSIETGLNVGDTKLTYLGAIYVSDGASLDGVTLYGSDQTFLVAEVAEDVS